MEDNSLIYKGLQDALSLNVSHLVDVKEIRASLF
jgi:hypothetical protein